MDAPSVYRCCCTRTSSSRRDGHLLERDALLRGAQGAELMHEVLLRGQVRVAHRGVGDCRPGRAPD